LELTVRFASRDTARGTLFHVIETIDGLQLDERRPFHKRMQRKSADDNEHLLRATR
jgi:hypothetical protein